MPEDCLPGLRPIMEAALKQSPGMIEKEVGIAKGEAQVYVYDHQLWPSLSGSSQYGTNKSATTGGASSTQSGLFYNIGISQPIFQWGALANSSRIGRIGLLISEKQYAEGYRQLAVQLRDGYLGLIVKKLAVRNARFAVKLSRSALDVAEQRLKTGAVSPVELVEPRLEAEAANLDLDRAEEDFDTARRMLARLAGLQSIGDDAIPLVIPKPAFDPAEAESLLAGLLRDRARGTFQAQVFAMQIRQDDLSYKIAKVQLLPKFSVATNYSVQSQTTAFGGRVAQATINQFTYNVNAQWTLFDGFATRGAKLSALADKRLTERQLQTYVETIEDQAQHSEHVLSFTARYQNLTDEHWKQQDAGLKHLLEELKAGNAAQNLVDTSTAAWYDTDYRNMSARADYFSQWSDFVSLVGRDPALDSLPPRYVGETP